jgi:hypothetical protein
MEDAPSTMSRRRILLLVVAALLCVSALLAIAILLVGRFGSTEGRILGTTALLAGYGIVALPAVVLLDQGRYRRLAAANAALSTAACVHALVSLWGFSDVEAVGKSVATATILALAASQSAALAARRQQRDPPAVRRLFIASCVTAALAAAAGVALMWTQPSDSTYPRLFGALVVLDLLLVALQPVLARARPVELEHRFTVVLATGETVQISISGGDVATAAARAIRAAERGGGSVVRLDVTRV